MHSAVHYAALMDGEAAALASSIGSRVKHERQERGWTLDQLAEAAQISRRMLVNVEQGAANPSVGTLLKISTALGVPLPALVEMAEAASATVTRHGEGAVLWRGDAGGEGALVASGRGTPDAMELWDWILEPGEEHVSEPHSPGTHELLQVHAGTLTIEVDQEQFALGAGDAAAFGGDAPHAYKNASRAEVRFSLAVYEPGAAPVRAARRTLTEAVESDQDG